MKLFKVYGQYNTDMDKALAAACGDAGLAQLVLAKCIVAVAAEYDDATIIEYIGDVQILE